MSPYQMHALEIHFPSLLLSPGFHGGFIGFSLDWFVSLFLELSPYFLYHYYHLLLFVVVIVCFETGSGTVA